MNQPLLITVCWLTIYTYIQAANAAVLQHDWKTPGDGLLTYDDVNQREWLDLTETQMFQFSGDTLEEKYAAVIAQTLPDGRFEGFSIAKFADVIALAESGGINTSTFDLGVNLLSTAEFIDLLGDAGVLDDPTRNRISRAISTHETGGLISVSILHAPAGLGTRPGPPLAGLSSSPSIGGEQVGVWLYRPIPEPSTFVLGGICIFLYCYRLER